MQGAWGNVTHSPDGGHLLAAAADQSLALIELPAWKEVRRFVGHADLISKAVFTPDGKYAVSSSFDRTVRVWEVATGREVWRFGGSAGPVHGVGLLGDGRRVVAAGADKVLRVWDLATGQLLQEFPNHDDKIGVIVVAEDGRQVLVGTDAGTLVRYRLPVAPTAAVAEKAPDLGGVPAVIADKAGHVPPGLDWPDKGSGLYAYKDGRLLVRETGGGCWGLTQHRASHFAAELVGRVTGAPKQFWGLAFARVDDPGGAKERRRGVQVGLDRQNRLWISPLSFSTEPGREPLVGPLTPPALKPLTEFNTLRVEVRGRMVTVWVNGVLAGPPVLLDEELAPAYVYLRAEGGDKTSVLELDRLSAWSVADRPLPPLPATLEPTSPAEPAPSAAVREGRVALPALAPKQRLYHETFATARGWPHFKNGDGETSFTDGAGVVKHLKSWDLGWRCPFADQANLIVQVEGRAQGPPDARWGLALASYKAGRGIRLLFDGEGRYLLEPDPAEGEKYLGPFVGIHPSPPGKAAEGWHQATLMVRDRKVQTFIDGRAVTDPLPLGRDLGAVQIFLVSHGGAGTRSEFRRLSVWSAENVAWPAAK
jgi:hypothetical protein